MRNIGKILLSLFAFATVFGFSFAADPDAFFVEVSPDSFSVGESVDMTITAIKSDGTTVKDYEGDVFIIVQGLMMSDYVAPSNGLYEFTASDQGVKLFSKGLKINKAGTYKVNVSALLDDSIVGEATIIVGNSDGVNAEKNINITYPIAGSTESKSSLNVMGSNSELKNSPVEIYLNKSLVANDYTDAQGNFNTYISGLRSGQNEIQVKIVDINNVVLGESDVVYVNYVSPTDGIFEAIEILPSKNKKQGDKITINVTTSESVSSAELSFSNGSSYPMDRVSMGLFSKDITLTTAGVIDVSLALMVNGITNRYSNIASMDVEKNVGIHNVKFSTTGVDGTSLVITWDQIGDPASYSVLYGTQKDNLQRSLSVSTTGILVENLQRATKYYFQIIPMDSDSHASGEPTEVLEYTMGSVSCSIKGIKVSSEKIGDKYYLVWGSVENAISYEIYRSDWADMSSMTKVGDTTGTRFEYYFNKDAESDQYAYYQVQAICSDGSSIMIQNVEKVKVGPFENIVLILVITFFIYCVYRLYRTVTVKNEEGKMNN